MVKNILVGIGLIVLAFVLIGAIGRAPAPVVIPDSQQSVVEAERIVSTAASGGDVSIDPETLRLLGAMDEMGDTIQNITEDHEETVRESYDTIEKVVISGDASQTAIAIWGNLSNIGIAAVILIPLAWLGAKVANREQSDKKGGE